MIEGIVEIVGEILLEPVFFVVKNDDMNKYLRYFLMGFFLLFYTFLIVGLFIFGISLLKKAFIGGVLLIIASIFISLSLIVTYKRSMMD